MSRVQSFAGWTSPNAWTSTDQTGENCSEMFEIYFNGKRIMQFWHYLAPLDRVSINKRINFVCEDVLMCREVQGFSTFQQSKSFFWGSSWKLVLLLRSWSQWFPSILWAVLCRFPSWPRPSWMVLFCSVWLGDNGELSVFSVFSVLTNVQRWHFCCSGNWVLPHFVSLANKHHVSPWTAETQIGLIVTRQLIRSSFTKTEPVLQL